MAKKKRAKAPAKKAAKKIDPEFDHAVKAAYKRGLTDGEKRKSYYVHSKLLRSLTGQFDAKAKQGITAAYDLGVQDGERTRCRICRNKTIAKLRTANHHLYEGLLASDRDEPVPGIFLSPAEAQTVIDALDNGIRNKPFARLLQHRAERHARSFQTALAELAAVE